MAHAISNAKMCAMIEYRDDHYSWNPTQGRFLLLEPDLQPLAEVVIERTDVQDQRVHEG